MNNVRFASRVTKEFKIQDLRILGYLKKIVVMNECDAEYPARQPASKL